MNQEMNERQAVEHLNQGDERGLEFLVRAYQQRALRAAYLITLDQALAEDIVQTAFLRVYEQIHMYDKTRPFEPWLLQIVVNISLRVATRHKREFSLDAASRTSTSGVAGRLATQGPSVEELVEQDESDQTIWEALRRLPLTQRSAIIQRYYLGMTEAEMANAAKCAKGTIKWRLNRARERLRSLLRPMLRS